MTERTLNILLSIIYWKCSNRRPIDPILSFVIHIYQIMFGEGHRWQFPASFPPTHFYCCGILRGSCIFVFHVLYIIYSENPLIICSFCVPRAHCNFQHPNPVISGRDGRLKCLVPWEDVSCTLWPDDTWLGTGIQGLTLYWHERAFLIWCDLSGDALPLDGSK